MKNNKNTEKFNENDFSYEELNENTTLVTNKKTGYRLKVIGYTREAIRNIAKTKEEMYSKMGY